MKFSEAEKQILIAITWISRNKPPDRKKLTENGQALFNDDLVDWGESLDDLIKKDIVREIDGNLSVAPNSEKDVKPIVDEWTERGFSEWMIKSEKSRAYSMFCERLYGKDLCQCSMTNMRQLDKLLEILSLSEKSKVLDLGCGIGTVTEYISDTTGANVTGLDIAAGAIERAQERTKDKRDRLTFVAQSMDDLSLPETSFDTIISIDTFYFVNDLAGVIDACRRLLTSGGQMGIFYTQVLGKEDPKQMLLSDHTKLARALKTHGLVYRSWDYTDDERNHWKRSKDIAEELKTEFENEGNKELYDSRIKESDKILKAVNDNRISRYFYHIHL